VQRLTFTQHLHQAGHTYLAQLMQDCGGNVSLAARIAGRNRTDFYKLLYKYGVRDMKGGPPAHGNTAWQGLGVN
jgi:transcriptional regulator of acetoin/glycerol metabolism